MRTDTRELRDDRGDRAQFRKLAAEVQTLVGKPVKMKGFDSRVLAALGQEKRETKNEIRKDTREIRKDNKRVRRGKKGVLRKLDAKIDRVDDKLDRASERADLGQVQALRRQYLAVRGLSTPKAVAEKHRILTAAANLQNREVQKDKAERREDIVDVKQKKVNRRRKRR